LFNPIFHQEVLHNAICGENHFLPLESHLGQWKSYSQCMWPRVHIMDVDVCSMHVSHIEIFYMDSIRVRVHYEANLWQTQRILMGMGECGWTNDPRWFLTTPRYHLFWLKAQEGHLAFTQKPGVFHSVMGLCSLWWCFLFIGCRWGEWESSPFHHKDPNIYIVSSHAPIWSHMLISMDAMVGTNDVKYHLFTLITFFSLHMGANCWLSWIDKHVKTWWNG
jgi:hypothetical protein